MDVLLFFLGHYVYIETSAPRVKGDKAWLLSQSFNSFSGHGRCMSFWYHMYGAGIGEYLTSFVPKLEIYSEFPK